MVDNVWNGPCGHSSSCFFFLLCCQIWLLQAGFGLPPTRSSWETARSSRRRQNPAAKQKKKTASGRCRHWRHDELGHSGPRDGQQCSAAGLGSTAMAVALRAMRALHRNGLRKGWQIGYAMSLAAVGHARNGGAWRGRAF